MNPTLAAAAILLLSGTAALPHRLDEYLQAALITVERNRIEVQITLTPGVAVFPVLLAGIDMNADGMISGTEQRAYTGRVLGDLSLRIDGHSLTPRLLSAEFPAIEELQGGRGGIRIELGADLPRGGPTRKLSFENRHQSRIAAYQVNCLVPRDPSIRILTQNRNYSQSIYELDFSLAGGRSNPPSLAWTPDDGKTLGIIALLLVSRLAWQWGRRARQAECR